MDSKYKLIRKLCFLTLAFIVPWIVVYYLDDKIIAYEAFLNNHCIAYSESKERVEKLYGDFYKDLTLKYGTVNLDSKITFSKVFIHKDLISNDELVKNNITASMNVEVDCFDMKIGDKRVGTVLNKEQGDKIIESIKEYYISLNKIDKNNLVKTSIKEPITYLPKKLFMSDINNSDSIYKAVLNYNEKSQKPVITIEIYANSKKNEKIVPATYQYASDELFMGENKVKFKGEDGLKEVNKLVTINNLKVVAEKIISSNILVKPKDRVILKGTKNPIGASIAFLSSPSRGMITSNFGTRWGNETHHGIDIAGKIGDPVYATLDGVVNMATFDSIYGKVIKIDHGKGIETLYGHCSDINVKVGQNIKKGDIIGRVGNTGRSTGPHLHFELRVNGVAQNPSAYIR